jgi:serine O-acetyltransferase
MSHTVNEKEVFSQPSITSADDDVWQDIYFTAADVAKREPLLRRELQELILKRFSTVDMVAAVLAHKLGDLGEGQSDLYALIHQMLSEEQAILAQITTDMTAVKERDPACLNHLHVLLNMKGFHALETYRISHSLWMRGRKELAFALSNRACVTYCVDIHPAAHIGTGVMLDHGTGIVIGETAKVDDNVSILQNVTLGGTGKERGDRHPKIRSGVMIGAGAKILGNIEIGSMSKVAAGSVVLENVPPYCTVAGVPAKIVRRYFCQSSPALEMDQSVGAADQTISFDL